MAARRGTSSRARAKTELSSTDEESLAAHARRADAVHLRHLGPAQGRSCHPAVADVAVFGIPHDDWGEEVKAVVEPVPEAEPGPGLTTELLEFLSGRVAKFKLPRTIDYAAELPRDPNGKLYKRRLRDPYWAGRDRAI